MISFPINNDFTNWNTLTTFNQSVVSPTLEQTTYSTNQKNYPAVFLDVDGVLKKGNEPIPKAKEAIELIR